MTKSTRLIPSATLIGYSTAYAFIRNPATSSVLSCLVPSLGGANETALQSRRRTDQTATSEGTEADATRCPVASSSSPIGEAEVERLTRELNEAREQQSAMSEVLRVIGRSKFELQSVLQSLAKTAARLCRSDGAVIFQLESGVLPLRGWVQPHSSLSGNRTANGNFSGAGNRRRPCSDDPESRADRRCLDRSCLRKEGGRQGRREPLDDWRAAHA